MADKKKSIEIAKNHYLKIEFDKEKNLINIFGNHNGMKYLEEVCSALSKKETPEHWHLSHAFYTLTKDSIETIIHCDGKK